jgi:hypothetical protein
MPDYSYWLFGYDNNFLKALNYDSSDKLLKTFNIYVRNNRNYPKRIDQVEMDSSQNLYLYDNSFKKYIVINQNGTIISVNSTINKSTNRIEIDLEDFDTDELIEELERRGTGTVDYGNGTEVLQSIYEKRRLGKDYQQELDRLIWLGLGKIV